MNQISDTSSPFSDAVDASPDDRRPYEQLRSLIVEGALRPGDAVSERGLSERLSVGRMPIREAVKRLARDGLLEIVPMRGTFVRQMTVADLREIHEMRVALEGMAAFLAAQRGDHAVLIPVAARMRALAVQTEADTAMTARFDADEAQRAGWAYHDAIFTCTGNRRLHDSYRNLRDQSGLALQRIDNYDAARSRRALREHLELHDAIIAGDGQRARRLIWSHLEQAMKTRLKHLARIGATD